MLSWNDDKRMQSVNLIKTHAYETSKDIVTEKEKKICKNITRRYKNV